MVAMFTVHTWLDTRVSESSQHNCGHLSAHKLCMGDLIVLRCSDGVFRLKPLRTALKRLAQSSSLVGRRVGHRDEYIG